MGADTQKGKVIMETDLKVGDKVFLEDIKNNKGYIPKLEGDENNKQIKEYNLNKRLYYDKYNGYVVTEITNCFIECKNECISMDNANRNKYYGKNDLHLISKIK